MKTRLAFFNTRKQVSFPNMQTLCFANGAGAGGPPRSPRFHLSLTRPIFLCKPSSSVVFTDWGGGGGREGGAASPPTPPPNNPPLLFIVP